MGRQQARGVEDRIQFDQLVRLEKYGGERSGVTGLRAKSFEGIVWAAISSGASELDIGSERTTLLASASVTIRWDDQFSTLSTGRITLTLPEDLDSFENSDRHTVTNVVRVGRRRFLKLEYDA